MEYILIQLLNSLQYGLLLFLIASGLSLIFGIMNVINMAHASFYMLGAYSALVLSWFFDDFWQILLIGSVLSVIFGFIIEKLFFSYLYQRDHLQQVLMTYGLILIFEELRKILVGNDVYSIKTPPIFDFSVQLSENWQYPAYRLFLSCACLILVVFFYLIINKTKLGMKIRAAASNREMLQNLGVNYRAVQQIVFALGVFFAMMAGMLVAPQSSVFPGMGSEILIISFVVVVIGGIGSIKGAFIAAMLIGLADSFGKVYWQSFSGFSIYFLMAGILIWKPNGLFKVGS